VWVSKTELNKSNLKILFGKNRLTKEEREMYDHISNNEYETRPKEVEKYFPRKKRNSKSKAKRVRGGYE
jgi:hypothetical protein